MVSFQACLLLVACACLVPARSDLEQKDIAQGGTDVHNGNRWPMTLPSFARDERQLNEYAREGTNNTRNESHHEIKSAESGEGRAEKGALGKDCGGGAATKKGKKARNLRALNEHEAEPETECNEKDDSLGLPTILGISGAALVGVFAFGTIACVCSRRRIATKSVPGSVGIVVMGQPATESTPKDESNKNDNML